MFSKTVIGLFKNKNEITRVVADLHGAGIASGSIKVLDRQELETHENRLEGASSKRGLTGVLRRMFGAEPQMDHGSALYTEWIRSGGYLVAANTDESHAPRVREIMEDYSDKEMTNRMKMDLERREAEASRLSMLKKSPLTGQIGMAEKRTENVRGRSGEQTIPVIQEELRVGKREVRRGAIRVIKHVTETPVEETIDLRDETITIERHPVDRKANEADITEFADSRVEMIETVEEPVVSKEARVVEEITITKKIVDHRETVRDKLKKTDVAIEGLDGKLRGNLESSPAYEFGSGLGSDSRFRNRTWAEIQGEVRRRWEARGKGSWHDVAESIRNGWQSSRNRNAA